MSGRKIWRLIFLVCSFVFLFGFGIAMQAQPAAETFVDVSAVRPSSPTLTSLPDFQTSTDCQSALYNPGLDYGYGWITYLDEVLQDNSIYNTAPHSFHMIEDNDSNSNPLFGDIDSFGQVFDFPVSTNSLALDFEIKFDGWGTADTVFYSFFAVDFNGQLVPPAIFTGSTQKFGPGDWHSESYSWDSTNAWISTLKGKPIALVFHTENDLNTFGTEQLNVYIDDIQLKLCSGNSVPMGSIQGVISEDFGADLSDAHILLTYQPQGAPMSSVNLTFPDSNGTYVFDNVEGLPPGDMYQVWYVNDGNEPDRLGLWAGAPIAVFVDDQDLYNINFDVKNIDLISPAHEAEVEFPVTFTWTDRGIANDEYLLCIYDIETLDEVCSATPLIDEQATINQSDLENVPGSNFEFEFVRRYAWSITVVDGSGYDSDNYTNIGYSYGANAITFVNEASDPPDDSPLPDGLPPSGNSGADWTVMVYIAGDNSLGDPARYFDPSLNLQGQFAALQQLAQLFPAVNLVTLTDFYDDSGSEFCHLKSDGTKECQQLGEIDSSDPIILADFINDTLALFGATHTMLIISDHGHSIAGVAADETTSLTATMTPDEIRQAFVDAGLNGRKLDILFYNACLMGSFEAAHDASAFADYMVASADELWVLNIYDQLLPLLANPVTKNDPEAVAVGIVNAYDQSVQAIAPDFFVSSAAYDLSKANGVNTAVSNLAGVMANELAVSRIAMENIRNQAQVFDSSGNFKLGSEDAFVDLTHLAQLLRDGSGNTAVATAADNLLNTLGTVGGNNAFIIASQQTTGDNGWGDQHDLSNASGLSIYFPNGQTSGEQPTLTNLYLNRGIYQNHHNQTEWDEFLRMYMSGILNTGPVRLQSGSRPVSGALPVTAELYLPIILRE